MIEDCATDIGSHSMLGHLPAIRFAVSDVVQEWYAPWVKLYYQLRYQEHWRWYYLNWEQNQEFLP
jgi:hypothetical protein